MNKTIMGFALDRKGRSLKKSLYRFMCMYLYPPLGKGPFGYGRAARGCALIYARAIGRTARRVRWTGPDCSASTLARIREEES